MTRILRVVRAIGRHPMPRNRRVRPCSDNVKNGTESDIDCGGSCTGCSDGKTLTLDTDCLSTHCVMGVCTTLPPTVVPTTPADGALSMTATYAHTNGFTVLSQNVCDGYVVIIRIYGGGGDPYAAFGNDFVGYGATNCFYELAVAPGPNTANSSLERADVCEDSALAPQGPIHSTKPVGILNYRRAELDLLRH